MNSSYLTSDISNYILSLQKQRAPYLLKGYPEIHNWLEKNKVKNYQIEEHLGEWRVNILSSVDLSGRGLEFLPVNFGTVAGEFDISVNRLRSLEGSPKNCIYFLASDNLLETLYFSPEKVERHFSVGNNKLASLNYGPLEVGAMYDASDNRLLTELDCNTRTIKGHLRLFDCPRLVITEKELEKFKTQIGASLCFSQTDIPALQELSRPFLSGYKIAPADFKVLQEKYLCLGEIKEAQSKTPFVSPSKIHKI